MTGLCAGWSSWPPGPPIAPLRPRTRTLTSFPSLAHRKPRWVGKRDGRRLEDACAGRAASSDFSITYSEPPLFLLNAWLGILDRALESGQGALDDGAWPAHRAFIERDMAIVREARAGEIVAAMLTPEVNTACMNLAAFGLAPRIEAGAIQLATPRIEAETKQIIIKAAIAGRKRSREPAIEARYKWIEDTCRDNDRSIDDSDIIGWLIDMKGKPKTEKKLAALTQQMKRDRRNLRKLKRI